MFIYLWDSEGFSDRSVVSLKQLKMLVDLIGLPWVCCGDFNITFDEFLNSEWPDSLKCCVIKPDCETTASTSHNIIIDFHLLAMEFKY